MNTGAPPARRRSLLLSAAGILAIALTGCTGRGGGQLPPGQGFTGAASFGFSFSCDDKGGLNPPTGKLHIELSYTDHSSSAISSQFSIHGTADTVDPVLESMICIGQNTPPGGNELIFLGRFRPTSTPPAGFSPACATTVEMCRFEVVVRDNDNDRAPSPGDYFSITLSNVITMTSELDPATVFYTRAGQLSSGNLTVD